MDSRRMHDLQVQNETSSDDFVLHPRLPSLQEMAYNQIAIAVWYGYSRTASRRRYYEQYRYSDYLWNNKLELMDCDELIKTLTMPRFMKKILKKYLKKVREETLSCTIFFKYELLSENLEEHRIAQVDWKYFVWCPEGRINYKSTAIKMLHSDVLTKVQKFVIVSNFCLENEIKIFHLNRRPMKNFIRKVNQDIDPLLFYWICYLKNELHTITPVSFLRSYDYRDGENMIYKNKNHREAFDYFWNGLSAEHRVSFISDRLRTFENSFWNDSWFYEMSHDQLTNLLLRQPVAVILVFIKEIEMPEWAIMAWMRCKNTISNEQFVKLLGSIFNRQDINPILRQEYKMSVLLEIWNTASDQQKNYAARQTQLEETLVRRILYYQKKLEPSCFEFLLKFLSLKSVDFRKNLILKGNPSFIYFFDFNVVHEIFELCLPNFHGKVEFKNERIKCTIHSYFCKILYTVEDYDELNRRLLHSIQNLNIPLKDTLEKFIEPLIAANKREYQTHYLLNGNDISDFLKLSEFINKILQENVSTVLKMKESYFSSFSANSEPYEWYGSLSELSKLTEQEFVHERLQVLKHRLAKILQTTRIKQWVSYVRNYEMFTHIFSRCFENEEEMFLRVKRCIPIKNIICEYLGRIGSQVAYLNNLERFLDWYFFGAEEEMISFKLSLLNDPEIDKALEPVQKYDEQFRRKFLQWIGDPIELRARRRRIKRRRKKTERRAIRDQQLCRKFLRWIGNRIGFNVKRSTYGIILFFLFFILFAVLSVLFVHL
ncbi:uncharacterized protein LOC135845352 [Planococcus citri]|uniref:uncharacterized protein LOC135845352 n=1 Tax=Planococcus citri TaxID=170843 RepID=UPI0031F941CE